MSLLDAPFVTNEEIAHVLFKVASILDLLQENPYRVRAYRRAALGILMLPQELVNYIRLDEEMPLPGVGERMRGRLHELVNTGHMGLYETLLEELGEPLASLMTMRGVGPKTAVRLMRELRIGSIEELAAAAREGRIQALRGFGPKREEQIRSQAETMLEGAA